MDHSWYVNECDRQLNDTKYYQKQSSDLTNKVQERVKEYTTRILPKLHKQGNPGRPIISSNGHPTERISEFVDYYLVKAPCTNPSFIY